MTTEQWKPVRGFEGLYEVSDAGRIRSLSRTTSVVMRNGVKRTTRFRSRIRKLSFTKAGHHFTSLSKQGSRAVVLVHRVVLEAFIGPCPQGMECCHHNDIPTDNRLLNLRWDTRAANKRDAVRNGCASRGENQHNSKLTERDIRAIRSLATTTIYADLATRFGVNAATISRIATGKRWGWLV